MIVSHKRRFVYIGPPKTASTTLHYWLSQPAFSDYRWSPKSANQHHAVVPREMEDYFVFASIRNPFDRAVSLWAHSQTESSFVHDGTWPMDFEAFIRQYQPLAHWFYRSSQSEVLAPAKRIDALVRFENLEEDLASLPVLHGAEEEVPVMNTTNHPEWESLCSPELRRLIEYRWRSDWELSDF